MTNETTTNGNGATFSEAPASLNLRFDYQGFRGIQLTLRASTGKEVLTKLDGAMAALDKMGATPAGGQGGERNGRGSYGNPPADPNAPMCPQHGTPMQASKHGNGFYCPQRVAESGGWQDGSKPLYCKAKA